MKILNLYACLGGNRYKWNDVSDNIQVTAIELDSELARMYQERFPNDTVIVADAHQYLIDHYQEFDFIWSSPPCPTHSRARYWGHGSTGKSPVFPDLKLYEEIIFLQTHFKGKYIVENVIPYYKPLIHATKEIDRHLYWSNFVLTQPKEVRKVSVCQGKDEYNRLCKFHEVTSEGYNGNQNRIKILRNLVDYEIGEHIFKLAKGIHEANNEQQTELF